MNGKRQNKEQLFNAAVELTDSGERQAFPEEAWTENRGQATIFSG